MNPYAELIDPKDALLLLVDLQPSMLDPCADPERTVKNAGALIDAAVLFDMPVLFSEHNPEKLGRFIPALPEKLSAPRIMAKTEFSCLANAAMDRALKETGRRTLLLAGIEAHVCIFQTCADALRAGWRVHLISDAVTARRPENKRIGLRRMEKAGAVISAAEMAVFELLKQAGNRRFREALPLLKSL